MKLGNINFFLIAAFFLYTFTSYSDDKIKLVPLINLEELSPTFEEGKIELEQSEEKNSYDNTTDNSLNEADLATDGKIYINLKTLDKITAKTSSIRLAVGEKKVFGPLEIKALKCTSYNDKYVSDTVAYIQVKDLSSQDNNSVFLFNGWTFASSPTLQSIDHPVYDLWITSCENI